MAALQRWAKPFPFRPGNTFSSCSKSARGARVHIGQNLTPRLQKHFELLQDGFLFSITVCYLFVCLEDTKMLHHFVFRCQPEGNVRRNVTTPSHVINITRASIVNVLWPVLLSLLLTVIQHTGNSLPRCFTTSLFSVSVAQLPCTKISHSQRKSQHSFLWTGPAPILLILRACLFSNNSSTLQQICPWPKNSSLNHPEKLKLTYGVYTTTKSHHRVNG